MFNSIFNDNNGTLLVVLMLVVSLVCGVLIAFITSIKLKGSRSLFVSLIILPIIVSIAFYFLNIMIKKDSTTAITIIGTIAVGLGLIRFRSVPARAEEITLIFFSSLIGVLCGLGYIAYAVIASIIISIIYVLFMNVNFKKFNHGKVDKLLKITIPENLEYQEMFNDVFKKYLNEYDLVGVKTTGMGSMYKLSYHIVLKNGLKDKNLIDELRVMNGNLEISLVPYAIDNEGL